MTGNGVAPADKRVVGFKQHLRAEVVSGEGVYLFSERGVTALTGSHVEALAPLLDGTRDLAALRRDLPGELSAEQAANLLARLVEADLVALREPVEPGTDTGIRAFWEAGGIDPNAALTSTARTRVQLIAVDGLDGSATLAGLRAAGLTAEAGSGDVPPALGDADFSVVLCADYLSPELAEIDAAHREAGRPWLLAKPAGTQVWIGPVFTPPTYACWHCLATRLWGHRQGEFHVQAALGRRGPAERLVPSSAPLGATASHLIALEAAKWLAGHRYAGQRSVWTLDGLDLSGRRHEVRSRPQCESCGNPNLVREQTRRPVRFEPRAKVCRTGGGHRSRSPEEVLDTYQHLISPITGVLKEVRQDRRGPAFFNSFRAGPNLARGTRGLEDLRSTLRAENGGKGTTALHGKVSALCEALERHSGYFHGDEERFRGSFDSLGDAAVHPDTCQLFHPRQFSGRAEWNARHSAFQQVSDPFDESAVLNWTPVWSLTRERHRFLPTGMLYFDAPPEQRPWVYADSNGNAAGSSIEDATLQGMLELVERDAVALWWYNRTRAPGVDLDSFRDPWIGELREVHAAARREVWVLDVTSDFGIPTMAALSRRTDKPNEDIMFGFGAHLDPHVALRRALTELNQLMPAIVDLGADDDYGWDDPDAVSWWREATCANQPYLVPDPSLHARTPADFVHASTTDLYADVGEVRGRLEAQNLEVLVLDQTRPDIGLPVVKVIVPGLRGFWARFAPGRLYDVPVRLGRVDHPIAYEELNPYPLFL